MFKFPRIFAFPAPRQNTWLPEGEVDFRWVRRPLGNYQPPEYQRLRSFNARTGEAFRKIAGMPMFTKLALGHAGSRRDCPAIEDEPWNYGGITRVPDVKASRRVVAEAG